MNVNLRVWIILTFSFKHLGSENANSTCELPRGCDFDHFYPLDHMDATEYIFDRYAAKYKIATFALITIRGFAKISSTYAAMSISRPTWK